MGFDMKIAVFSNGVTVIVVGLDKEGKPIDKDGTLFGPESGRNIREFNETPFYPSRGEALITDSQSIIRRYLTPFSYLLSYGGQNINKKEHQPSDTEMLDWLQKQTKGYGCGWVIRNSTTGRGMRLHETSHVNGTPSIRQAIRNAMKNST